jgi:hypothetical protein
VVWKGKVLSPLQCRVMDVSFKVCTKKFVLPLSGILFFKDDFIALLTETILLGCTSGVNKFPFNSSFNAVPKFLSFILFILLTSSVQVGIKYVQTILKIISKPSPERFTESTQNPHKQQLKKIKIWTIFIPNFFRF